MKEYYTLKQLYDITQKTDPDLLMRFERLKEYCYDADELYHQVNLNRGYKSLKWLIYGLRDKISPSELQMVFHNLLIESCMGNESLLYNNVLLLPTAKRYQKYIQKPKIDLSEFPIKQIGEWRILINEGEQNITGLVFKKDIAEIIIFRNDKLQSAGIVFNERDTNVLSYFNVPKIFIELMKRNEPWTIRGNNLIICGGPKAPENKTSITTDELFELLKKYHLTKE